MKEYPEYRLVLENLRHEFGNRNFITVSELARFDGCCARTVVKRYGIKKEAGGIDIAILAHRKCELANK